MRLKLQCRAVALLTVASMVLLLLPGCSTTRFSPDVTQANLSIENYSPSISNFKTLEFEEPQMAYSDGKLFLYYWNNPKWNRVVLWESIIAELFYDYKNYHRTLVCIENGKITAVSEACGLLGAFENYVYFIGGTSKKEHDESLRVYNTKTNTVEKLFSFDFCPVASDLYYDFTSDGVLRIKDQEDDLLVHHFKEDKLLGSYPDELSDRTVQLGGDVYSLDYHERIYRNGEDVTDEFKKLCFHAFHPTSDGVVVESKNRDVLWLDYKYINSEGEIHSLVPELVGADPSRSFEGSVSVYGDYIFLSYQETRPVGLTETPKPYKKMGTYRIDARDLSRTKISEDFFQYMYIFDDTGMFVENENGIYKIDFDGNPLLTIVKG